MLVSADLQVPNPCTLQIRCVAHPSGSGVGTDWTNATSAHDELTVPPGPYHVRGWWPRIGARFSRPENDPFDVNPGASGANFRAIEVCKNDLAFEINARSRFGADETDDPHGTPKGNHGLYGANVRYRFLVKNTFASNKPLYLALRGRETAGFFGTCRLEIGPGLSPSQPPGVVLAIKNQFIPPPASPNLAELTSESSLVSVPSGGDTYYVDVCLGVAGLAALPVNILLAREDFDLHEVDGEEDH